MIEKYLIGREERKEEKKTRNKERKVMPDDH
jgi:hypothetical protein